MNFYIKNLGCKFNSFESNRIKELLLKNGFLASSSDDLKIGIWNINSTNSNFLMGHTDNIRQLLYLYFVVLGKTYYFYLYFLPLNKK